MSTLKRKGCDRGSNESSDLGILTARCVETQEIVSAESIPIKHADRPKVNYVCANADCNVKVVAKHGTVKRAHFAHARVNGVDGKKCAEIAMNNYESIIHKECKIWVRDHPHQIVFDRICHECKQVQYVALTDYKMNCEEPVTLNDHPYRLDVYGKHPHTNNEVVVEIEHKHPMGPDKIRDLMSRYQFNVFEVHTSDIKPHLHTQNVVHLPYKALPLSYYCNECSHKTCVDCADAKSLPRNQMIYFKNIWLCSPHYIQCQKMEVERLENEKQETRRKNEEKEEQIKKEKEQKRIQEEERYKTCDKCKKLHQLFDIVLDIQCQRTQLCSKCCVECPTCSEHSTLEQIRVYKRCLMCHVGMYGSGIQSSTFRDNVSKLRYRYR